MLEKNPDSEGLDHRESALSWRSADDASRQLYVRHVSPHNDPSSFCSSFSSSDKG